jgi:hypothetical protein
MHVTSQKTGNVIVAIIKVKVALEEAIKARIGRRGISLLFL